METRLHYLWGQMEAGSSLQSKEGSLLEHLNLADMCKQDRETAAPWYWNSGPTGQRSLMQGLRGLDMTEEVLKWQVAALRHVYWAAVLGRLRIAERRGKDARVARPLYRAKEDGFEWGWGWAEGSVGSSQGTAAIPAWTAGAETASVGEAGSGPQGPCWAA